MKFTKTSVGGTIEILAADDFVTIPICVTEAAAVPAGMPMTTAGKKVATTSYATAVGKLGIFFVDVRSEDRQWKNLIAYDSMLKTEQTYLISEDVGEWPRGMKALVADIASRIDVEVDSRTVINESYVVEYPNDYTMREILCHIAAAHAGNWIITADGKLLLVPLFTAMPPETYYLIEDSGSAIVFGEDRILV